MDPVTILMRWMQHRWNDERIAANPNNYNVYQVADVPYIVDIPYIDETTCIDDTACADDASAGESGEAHRRQNGRKRNWKRGRKFNPEYHLMDIYSPDDSGAKLPVIIEIHGGGYISCFKEVNRQHGQYLASKGFHVINMNYTLTPEADFRTTVKEVFAVIEWVKEHADEYGFDTERLFLTGDSAGGHIVLVTAAAIAQDYTASYFGVGKPAITPKGYALICPAADIRELLNQKAKYVILKLPLIRLYRDKEYMRRIGYRYLVKGGLPYMFIQTTPTDPQVYTNTKNLHEAMEAAGINHMYKEYCGRGHELDHVFSVIFPDYEESIEANDDIIKYFKSC